MSGGYLGCVNISKYWVDVLSDNVKPFHCSPYLAKPMERPLATKETNQLIAEKIIEPASTKWAAPIVFYLKKDGLLRFFVDYRKLSALTMSYTYPFPRMDDCIDRLGETVMFSTPDDKSK